jgi:hypothetical protein
VCSNHFDLSGTAAWSVQGLCEEAQAQGVYAARRVPGATTGKKQCIGAKSKRVQGSTFCINQQHQHQHQRCIRVISTLTPDAACKRMLSPSANRGLSTDRQWNNARIHPSGGRNEAVVLVKNEELIQTGVSAMEYLRLVKGSGGKMGGALCAWLRVGRSGAYGLDHLSACTARAIFSKLTGKSDNEIQSLFEGTQFTCFTGTKVRILTLRTQQPTRKTC